MNTYATIELPFLYNGKINTSITIEVLLGNGVICWGRSEAIKREELRESVEYAVEDDGNKTASICSTKVD
jgi:hypothetical protein